MAQEGTVDTETVTGLTQKAEEIVSLSIENDMNLERTREALIRLMTEDERVFKESSRPAVFVLNANPVCIELLTVC